MHAYQGIAFRTAYVDRGQRRATRRRRRRTASSRRGARSAAFATALRFVPGCCGSSPTRRATGAARRAAARSLALRAATEDVLGGRGPVPRGGTALGARSARRCSPPSRSCRRSSATSSRCATSSGCPSTRSRRRSTSRRERSSRARRVRSSGCGRRMTELERALARARHELEFPPSPDVWPRRRRSAAAAALACVRSCSPLAVGALAIGIAMAVPAARSAILSFFHIGSVTIERVETLPPAQTASVHDRPRSARSSSSRR